MNDEFDNSNGAGNSVDETRQDSCKSVQLSNEREQQLRLDLDELRNIAASPSNNNNNCNVDETPMSSLSTETPPTTTSPPFQIGDHIYKWCSVAFIPSVYQHHAIVMDVWWKNNNDNDVNFDDTAAAYTKGSTTPPENSETNESDGQWMMTIADFSNCDIVDDDDDELDGSAETQPSASSSSSSSSSSTRKSLVVRRSKKAKGMVRTYDIIAINATDTNNNKNQIWHKVQYNANWFQRNLLQRSGTCTAVSSDAPGIVRSRVQFVLDHQNNRKRRHCSRTTTTSAMQDNDTTTTTSTNINHNNEDDDVDDAGNNNNSRQQQQQQDRETLLLPPYNTVTANCECFAVWCKTGTWATLQAMNWLFMTAAGQAKSAVTVASAAAATQVTVPAAGLWGWLGYTTHVSLLSTQPYLLPAIAAYGVITVGAPAYWLLRAKHQCQQITIALNTAFWDEAIHHPEIFVESITYWSALYEPPPISSNDPKNNTIKELAAPPVVINNDETTRFDQEKEPRDSKPEQESPLELTTAATESKPLLLDSKKTVAVENEEQNNNQQDSLTGSKIAIPVAAL